MPLEVPLKPIERIVFRSDAVAVAQFRCPATHPLFHDSGPCSNHTFVFPRTSTAIARSDGTRFIGSPNVVAFYNQHDTYRREAVSRIDATDWYVVADDILAGAIALFDPAVHDRPSRPFRFAHAPVDTSLYIAQRRLFNHLSSNEPADVFGVEESVLGILGHLLASAYGRKPMRATPAVRDAVTEAQRLIAVNPARTPNLRQLAARTGISAFHLCRAFARMTGTTMTDFRNALRVRLALDRVRDRATDLSALAATLGFSSHSHFTSVFRRHVGVPPSAFRAMA